VWAGKAGNGRLRVRDVRAARRAGRGHHRSVQHPDLLVAAAAERAGIAVLHHDQDFDRIAAVTGQPTSRLASRGSLA
jgi:predicted nucleic acid-binding protein